MLTWTQIVGRECVVLCQGEELGHVAGLAMIVVPVGNLLAIPLVVEVTLTVPAEHVIFHVRTRCQGIFSMWLCACVVRSVCVCFLG